MPKLVLLTPLLSAFYAENSVRESKTTECQRRPSPCLRGGINPLWEDRIMAPRDDYTLIPGTREYVLILHREKFRQQGD